MSIGPVAGSGDFVFLVAPLFGNVANRLQSRRAAL
jgi:hypothetical protein